MPTEEMTITNMLNMLSNNDDQKALLAVTTELTESITKLKRLEQLNRELLEQSMQFVQMSLNMLNPTIDHMNYGDKKQTERKHSMFDSKA